MIGPSDYMCGKVKEIYNLYTSSQQLKEKYKKLTPAKKANQSTSYQNEIASNLDKFREQLGFLNDGRDGIVNYCWDAYTGWDVYFRDARNNLKANKYTMSESFKCLDEMLRFVKKIVLTIKKAAINVEKALSNYMKQVDTLYTKYGRNTDRPLPVTAINKIIKAVEISTSSNNNYTNFGINRLFLDNSYKDLVKKLDSGDLTGTANGHVYANMTMAYRNVKEVIKYLDKKIGKL